MSFRRSDLQPAFSVPGTFPFTVWGYGTSDPLEEVLQPRYLLGGGTIVQPGERIYVSIVAQRDPLRGRENGVVRAALVMVSGLERGDASLQLVQDFGAAGGGIAELAGPARATLRQVEPAPAEAPEVAGAEPAPAAARKPPRRARPRRPGQGTSFTAGFATPYR